MDIKVFPTNNLNVRDSKFLENLSNSYNQQILRYEAVNYGYQELANSRANDKLKLKPTWYAGILSVNEAKVIDMLENLQGGTSHDFLGLYTYFMGKVKIPILTNPISGPTYNAYNERTQLMQFEVLFDDIKSIYTTSNDGSQDIITQSFLSPTWTTGTYMSAYNPTFRSEIFPFSFQGYKIYLD